MNQQDERLKRMLTADELLHLPQWMKMDSAEEKPVEEEDSVLSDEVYEPESSVNLLAGLEMALRYQPDYHQVYKAYNRVFRTCLDLKTSAVHSHLVGPFAKTDYLLKEHGASAQLVKNINDTRVRLRKSFTWSDEELKRYYLFDLKHLCEFIAFLYPQTEIPHSLSSLFPVGKLADSMTPVIGESVRVIVERWDQQFVYGPSEEAAEASCLTIDYLTGNRFYDFDWSYLEHLFYKGAQLNLIRPREKDGILYPELIIFEPDYLVDISTVARCFTNYAESPFVHLIHKISPAQVTEPIVLGNFAGQLLDEAIHQQDTTHSYLQSVQHFFKESAIQLLTANIGSHFHTEAQLQKYNISQAICHVLPNQLKRFDSKEGIVEPSFFSEMLGLQGRMDYLQSDFRVLIEQKSGKGEFPYDNFVVPKHREEHYVQILLYMALIRYNYHEIYKKNGEELHAYLLYSKYQQSLLGLGFAPELIFRAMKVRNEIAWTELCYTRPEGFRLLESMTADTLNMKQANNMLWSKYQRQQMNEVLGPIHQASELEKSYFFRFMTFIANEQMLSKLGNKTKENSGFASKWHDSLEEKLQAGNIYCNLNLISPTADTESEIDTVILQFMETQDNDMSNFRVGDVVILYPYEKGAEPDVRSTMVFRCTIDDLQKDTIRLVLRAVQSDGRVFRKEQGKLWAIEHDFLDSSFSPLYRGMHLFLTTCQNRRDLLLLQRRPECDSSVELKGDYGSFNDLSLQVKRAKDLFLIIGPPGTGKTSFGMLNTVKEELLEPKSSVLITSYTNRAIDEICSKLVDEGIDFIRIGTTLNCAPAYRNYLLSSKVKSCCKLEDLKRAIVSTRVFVGTTASFNGNLHLFQLKNFSLAVVDEASQILEPHLMGLLCVHHDQEPAIRKFVLIGDHRQLPAVVQQTPDVSKVHEPELNDILLTDCRLSLFERLLREYRYDESVTYMLTKQGRMHQEIAQFPSCAFYNNNLKEVPRPHQIGELPLQGTSEHGIVNLLSTRRVAFLHAPSPEHSLSDKVNQVEADMIAATVVKIYEIEKDQFDVDHTVGVIVPYRNQIATVRNTLDCYGIGELHDITIDTVERYQGSQRKYIIYGFTVQQYYQLNFLTNNVFEDIDSSLIDRKLNVAMTRAEEHLLLIGNAKLLSNSFIFFKLLEFVRSKQSYFEIVPEDYCSGHFEVPAYEEAEICETGSEAYELNPAFSFVFNKRVLLPVRKASGSLWPRQVFGADMNANMQQIGYGRINALHPLSMPDGTKADTERQVLLYCYYLMRQYYRSSKKLYMGLDKWLHERIASVQGRVQLIDMGCGPATCGLSFFELYGKELPDMFYVGIDISDAMKQMGSRLIDEVYRGKLRYRMVEAFSSLGQAFWDSCSELSSLVIFNFSYLFANVSAQFAEQLARQIGCIMEKYPLNNYLFIVQQSIFDRQLNSYRVFLDVLNPQIDHLAHTEGNSSYSIDCNERTLQFCYDLFTQKSH